MTATPLDPCQDGVSAPCCHDRLLQAATEAFLEEGYRASVDRIAARAGVAKQTLYNHFGTKEELFRAVGLKLADSVAIELSHDIDGLAETLVRFGLDLRERILGDRGLAIYRSFHVESARAPEVTRTIHQRVMTRLIELISNVISRAMDQGQLRRDDPQLAAEMLLSMLVHIDRGIRLAGHPRLAPADEEQRVRAIIDFFLRSLASTPNAQPAQEQK
ncbi:MAG TPA: TetR/AcrR family transcriptional regulator [Rhodocyclaceae bacterium]|nr:TetR/AcrR family transcriptional regulator [Rhodocyclaceae bacterium]